MPDLTSKKRSITVSAPGRAGIIGNPTDMYGGSVLSCSMGLRASVTISSGSGLTIETGNVRIKIEGEKDLQLQSDCFDIVRSVISYTGLPECSIRFDTKIPRQSGLAGSTALITALLKAVYAWQGKYPSSYQLAEDVRLIEYTQLKIVCGFQDAYMCAFGGINFMDFRGKYFNEFSEEMAYASVESLSADVKELPFILACSGVLRISGAVHKPLSERWLSGETEVVEGYKRITELAGLGKKALILKDWQNLGRLMNENHEIQRRLVGSNDANERMIKAALESGALGAKLAGAGGGGTIIVLKKAGNSEFLVESLKKAGAKEIYNLEPSNGVMIESDSYL